VTRARTRFIRRHLPPVGVALISLFFLAGTAAAVSPSPSAAPTTVIHFGWTANPDSLNPFTATTQAAYEIINLNYDLLTKVDPATWQPAPSLAKSWETSVDGKTWTFHLVHNATWQDGVPLTARDVAFTFNYIIDNKMGNFLTYTEFIEKAVAVDDYTVQIICSQPKANMLGLWIPIVPQHIWKSIDPKKANATFQNDPPIIGSGPYQVVEFKKSDYVRLVANKTYFRGAPKNDQLIFQTYQSADTMTQDMKSGTLAACWGIPDAQFKPLGARSGIALDAYTPIGFDQLGFNCYMGKTSLGNPVLRDARFRSALNWAVDKQRIVNIAYGGYAVAGSTIIQPNMYTNPDWHWQPAAGSTYSYDPAKAAAALDAADYKDTDGDGIRDYGGKPITLRLWARTESETSQRAGKLLAGELADVGLKIDYQVLDEGAILDKEYNTAGADAKPAPDFDMVLWGWNPDMDPNFILGAFTTAQIGSWSDCFWSNAEYDRLYKEQGRTIDRTARKQIVDRMQEMLYTDSPYIVLAYPESLEAYNVNKWQGWLQSPAKVGSVFYVTEVDQYRSLQPKADAVVSHGSRTGLVAGVAVAAAVVLLASGWAIMRRRRAASAPEEEA
jgi:peptide/nickel transport system substrate-binding protein